MLPEDVAIHTSATDLLARDDIDAVVVAAPTVFHADLAVAVLESGRHLLVEKPLALDSTDAARVARAGAATGCGGVASHVHALARVDHSGMVCALGNGGCATGTL